MRRDDIVWTAWKHAAARLTSKGLNGITLETTNKENTMKITLELVERFHEKWTLNESNGCWEWTGATAGKGYGFMKRPGERRQVYAHRLSYEIHCGVIPEGMQVCHSCDNMKCVKPTHLFLGTQKDNLQDMKSKDRHLHGERNKKHKLTTEKVLRIYALNSEGVSQNSIAKAFGVTQGLVWRILHGLAWGQVYRDLRAREGE